MSLRKIAATRVYLDVSSPHTSLPEFYTNHVIELTDHILTNHYPLTTELPHTEWIGGTIVIRNQRAYHTGKVLSPEEAHSHTTDLNAI